jgi:ABC-type phosphate transport system substrate-binding protein
MKSLTARGILPACLISAAALVALAMPGAASAALGEQCSGAATVEGAGSSLQAEAVLEVFSPTFNSVPNTETSTACNGEAIATKKTAGKPEVKYHTSSSGKGYAAWNTNHEYGVFGFIGTDNTVNPSEKASVEAEGTSETGGKLLTIPVAEGAVSLPVHLPAGCVAESKAAKGRLSLSGSSIEKIFADELTKWSELTEDGNNLKAAVPTKVTKVKVTALSNIIKLAAPAKFPASVVAGTPIQKANGIPAGTKVANVINEQELELTNAATLNEASDTVEFNTTCNTQDTITTIVRKDGSGTTHIFKRWLNWNDENKNLENGVTKYTWDELSEGANSTKWPNGVGVTNFEGSQALVEGVAATESSIGYANLADAWHYGFAGTVNAGEKKPLFWALVENGEKSGVTTYADPSSNKEIATRGNANCASTVYSNGLASFPPPSVESNWNEVTADQFSKTYPICGLTYDLALANYRAFELFGTTLGEAQDVHDYLQFVLNSKGGQKQITKDHDYESLPKTVLTKSLEGLPLITWNP